MGSRAFVLRLAVSTTALAACGSPVSTAVDGGHLVLMQVDASEPLDDAATPRDASAPRDAATNRCTTSSDRFIKQVVSFDPGPCAGFGASDLPGIVCGPPEGGGDGQGGTDVVSLGNGGTIVVGFGDNEIVDGEGVDFIVFENPFRIGGNPANIYAEPGEVSVSEDGVTWSTFSCTDTTQNPPYGECAGVNPVLADPDRPSISPFDAAAAGGDAYDLASVGLSRAKYVRIRDVVVEACAVGAIKNGFDLDAIAIVHALHE